MKKEIQKISNMKGDPEVLEILKNVYQRIVDTSFKCAINNMPRKVELQPEEIIPGIVEFLKSEKFQLTGNIVSW